MRQLLSPWYYAIYLAKQSPRYALAPQIARMQELRRSGPSDPCQRMHGEAEEGLR